MVARYEAINQVLDAQIKHVAERIQELKVLQKQQASLRAQCSSACDWLIAASSTVCVKLALSQYRQTDIVMSRSFTESLRIA